MLYPKENALNYTKRLRQILILKEVLKKPSEQPSLLKSVWIEDALRPDVFAVGASDARVADEDDERPIKEKEKIDK